MRSIVMQPFSVFCCFELEFWLFEMGFERCLGQMLWTKNEVELKVKNIFYRKQTRPGDCLLFSWVFNTLCGFSLIKKEKKRSMWRSIPVLAFLHVSWLAIQQQMTRGWLKPSRGWVQVATHVSMEEKGVQQQCKACAGSIIASSQGLSELCSLMRSDDKLGSLQAG